RRPGGRMTHPPPSAASGPATAHPAGSPRLVLHLQQNRRPALDALREGHGLAPHPRHLRARDLVVDPSRSGSVENRASPGRIPRHAPRTVQSSGKEVEPGDVRKRRRSRLVRPTRLLPSESSANHPASLLRPDGLRAKSARFVEESSDRARIPAGKRWGYANLGLALAFQHGVPDATLPILWWEDNGWI